MRILLIVLVVAVAAGAGYFILQGSTAPEPQPAPVAEQAPQVQAVNILVAREVVPIGTVITQEMVDQQPWPSHLVLDGFMVAGDGQTNVVGMVTRSELQVQEPLSIYKLANPNDANFIAAALPKDRRALTLQVDTISGVGGYIFAGDHIDMILTHRIPIDLADPAERAATSQAVSAGFAETILENIKVLAVEIRGLHAFKSGTEQRQEPRAPTNLTIEVTPEQAQAVRLAERNGSISLALRPLKGQSDSVSESTELKDLTSAKIDSSKRDDSGVFIIRGVQSNESRASFAPAAAGQPSPIIVQGN